jgi:hypothetical protein
MARRRRDGASSLAKGKEKSSFLKKRSKRLLFPRRSKDRGYGLELYAGARHESLLVLFFRKEHLP